MAMDPLQMEDTLPCILKHLDADSLKSCRLVCTLWNEIGARQLFRYNFFRIPSDFRKTIQQQNEAFKLTKVQQFIRKLGNMPNILISDENLEEDLEILKRLNIRWNRIDHLKLDWKLHLDIEVYEHFLEEIKNLCGPHHLNFLEIPAQIAKHLNHSPLTYGLATAILEFCLFMTPNSSKPFTVSHLSAFVSCQKDVESLEELMEKKSRVRLLNLVIKPLSTFEEVDSPGKQVIRRHLKTLEKILEENKNLLRTLRINDRYTEILPPSLQIPKMPQLEVLQFKCLPQTNLNFQHGFQFSSHFPILHEVEIMLCNVEDSQSRFWRNFFHSQAEPAKSVKKLKISCLDVIDEQIFKVFPKIEELQINDLLLIRMQSQILQMLLSYCKNLKQIRFDLFFDSKHEHLRFAAALSGQSEREMKMLMSPTKWNTSKIWSLELEELSKRRSTLEFLDLEELHFICGSDRRYAEFSADCMEFLKQQLFSRMPNLQVKRSKE